MGKSDLVILLNMSYSLILLGFKFICIAATCVLFMIHNP